MKHDFLMKIVKKLPKDYEPYGSANREDSSDCSCGCIFYIALKGTLGRDWGVCTNEKSHRCGLLTFEHQGCEKFRDK